MLQEAIERLRARMPRFEARAPQVEMMQRVYEAMKSGKQLAVHAPTGTGKSLGYLVPFVAAKLEDPSFKMIISTYTLHLQEQVQKDIAVVNEIYRELAPQKARDIKAVTWKGKSNYFCADNAQRNRNRPEGRDQPAYLSLLGEASRQMERHGRLDRQHLAGDVPESVWRHVHATVCHKEACQHYRRCTYIMDYAADPIDILILNHALYFNLRLFKGPFEDYPFAVFDEAHHVEKVAIEAATMELGYDDVVYWAEEASRLARQFGEPEGSASQIVGQAIASPAVSRLRRMTEIMRQKMKGPTQIFSSPRFSEMIQELEDWQKSLYQDMRQRLDPLAVSEAEKKQLTEALGEWAMAMGSLPEFAALLARDDTVSWAQEISDRLTFHVSPRSVAFVEGPLFPEGTLFTSGTLAEDGRCGPFTERLFLEDCADIVLPTPFDLGQRTMVYVSPSTDPRQGDRFEDDLEREIWSLLLAGDMKVFVLFSSLKLMREMHRRMAFRLHRHDPKINCFLQERNNKDEVIDAFRDDTQRTVLFGSLTFFEGVDLRRDSLTQVIITRVPFAAPDHPVQQILNERGPYSFWEARMRLEQAYGRLIRTNQDYGSFAVLDRRVTTYRNMLSLFRAHGVHVTQSLDEIKVFHETMRASLLSDEAQ